MKVITILSLLLLASPAFGELTKEDIRTIVKEEITASEKRTREYIDLKIETVNTKIDAVDENLNAKVDDMDGNFDPFWIVMIIILTAVILPQIIIVFLTVYDEKERRKDIKTQIQQLRERLNALENTS